MADEYQNNKKYGLNFTVISPERFKKSEQELLAYKMPLIKLIELNSILDMQAECDKRIYETMRVQEPEQTLEEMLNIIFSDGEIRD